MKFIPILLTAMLYQGAIFAQVNPAPVIACGNANLGGVGGGGGCSPSATSSPTPNPTPGPSPTPPPCDVNQVDAHAGDPVVPYTGNEFKRVDDLEIWGSPGQLGMVWSRHSNSRAVGGGSLFGLAHYWRHSFQWEFSAASNDSLGRRRMTLTYPDGAQFNFVEMSAGTWLPETTLTDKLVAVSDGFRLDRKDGTQCFFKRRGAATTPFYLMEEIRDAVGNSYRLEYNSSRQVTRITEPGGRFFSVAYQTLSGSRLNPSNLAMLAAAPAAGAWSELTINNSDAFRFVRLVQADKSFGQIAEVEFYEAGTGAKLSGQVICSDSAAAGQMAMDGSASTGFVSAAQSGGFVGLDLGTAKKIGRVRFLSVAGKEALQKPTGFRQNAVRFEGANQAPVSTLAISSVQTSDGRSVTYEYTPIVDPTLPYVFPALTSVRYGDGTRSTYKLAQVFPGTRPLVIEWDDLRYGMRQGRYKTVYQNDTLTTVFGAVSSQVNLETGKPILTVGLNNNNLHQPMVTFGHGGKDVKTYNSSLPTGAAISRTTDANNNSIDYTFDNRGYIATKKDSLGRTTGYTWTAQGQLLDKTHPDGSRESWTYNGAGHITSHTDTLGRTTVYTLDARNLVTRVDFPDGTFESFQHNAYGKVLRHRQRNGGVATYAFDASGLLTQSTDPMGNTSTYGYSAAGRLTRVTDALGRTTAMEYNDRGLVTKVTNPDGTSKSYTYTPYGDLASETNELGHTWTHTYDVFRRLTSTTDPLGRTSRTEYHPESYENKPLSITLPSGKKTIFQYDRAWNLTSKTEGAGSAEAATTSYSYDNVNNLIGMVDGTGKAWTYTYDNRNRPVSASDPLGNTTLFAYDAVGNLISSTRPDGKTSSSTYDTMNRLTSSTDQAGNTTSFAYDQSGNLLSTTDAKGGTYSYSYDSLNRRLSMSYPSTIGGSSERWSYDSVGKLSTYTTRAGQVCTYSYDTRNRNTGYSWSDGTQGVSKSYDVAGRLLSLSNAASLITYSYDSANELLSETQSVTGHQPHTLSYSYDLDGNRTGVQYPSGSQLGLGYNGRNLPASIVVEGTSMATFRYDGNGKRVSRALENGITTTASYDAASRLTGLSSPVASYSYSLDRLGRRTTRSETTSLGVKSDSYAYDPISQLTGVNYASGARSTYAYDALGNRTSVVATLGSSTTIIPYLANACNQYTQIGGLLVSSDANGNLTSDQNGNTYTYDANNRLVSARSGTNTMSVAYDAQNRVVSRTLNGVVTSYAYDGWNLIEDYDASGNELARYIHGTQSDEMLAKISPTGAVYYIQDGNQNVTTITDERGAVLERYTYDVYGAATITDGAGNVLTVSGVGNRFLFTGRELISQIGIYDYRNRVYSASLGRFLQADPIRFAAGDVNLYRFVGNGPVNWVDPLGLCTSVPVYNPGLVNNNVLGGDYASNLPGGTDPGANFEGLGFAALATAAIATGGEVLVAAAPSMGGLATAGYNAAYTATGTAVAAAGGNSPLGQTAQAAWGAFASPGPSTTTAATSLGSAAAISYNNAVNPGNNGL